MPAEDVPPELLGLRLHGDDLGDEALSAWFADEIEGYQELIGDGDDCGAAAVNHYHLFRHLPPGGFARCLALGAASGIEYEGLRGRVDSYVAIEPGQLFWRDSIAGAPAEYRMPTPRGMIELPDGSCDLAGSFGVLHHVANVSEVLREVARVLAPGAPLMIREPIVSLGDFRRPRPGLTRNERGIPHRLMDDMLAAAGFRVTRKSLLRFPRFNEVVHRLGVSNAWENTVTVRLDAALSRITAWNVRYWRPRLWHKAAPTMACWLAIRR